MSAHSGTRGEGYYGWLGIELKGSPTPKILAPARVNPPRSNRKTGMACACPRDCPALAECRVEEPAGLMLGCERADELDVPGAAT